MPKKKQIVTPFALLKLSAAGAGVVLVLSCTDTAPSAAQSVSTGCPTDDAGSDPLYGVQWHLRNRTVASEDVNAEPAWASTFKGSGVRIAVVDDGVEIGHEDLCQNVAAGASYNYVNGSTDPTGGSHGTSVAGVAAARDLNNRGVRGAAPRAELVGYNLLANATVINEGDAMVRGKNTNAISSNSWGAPDYRGTFDKPSTNWLNAINEGLANGRNGKGTVYVWAAGNGHLVTSGATTYVVDNSNYDGQANHRGVIAVAAVKHDGHKASYSEPGANLWVSAPAGEWCGTSNVATTTVDRTGEAGLNKTGASAELSNLNYTQCFNGTSAATPVVSGVVALMLQARPELSWRDVKLILAETARQNDTGGGAWRTNGAGYAFSHNYGFGVVDAKAAVDLAQTWTPVTGSQIVKKFSSPTLDLGIPGTPVTHTIPVTSSSIAQIEFIEIAVTSDHTYAGDLAFTLQNAAGTTSELSHPHLCNGGPGPCHDLGSPWTWTFGSAAHLGEAADGEWTLSVYDGVTDSDIGKLISWSITFYGR